MAMPPGLANFMASKSGGGNKSKGPSPLQQAAQSRMQSKLASKGKKKKSPFSMASDTDKDGM